MPSPPLPRLLAVWMKPHGLFGYTSLLSHTSVEEEGDEYETFCFITDYGNCRTRWRAE